MTTLTQERYAACLERVKAFHRTGKAFALMTPHPQTALMPPSRELGVRDHGQNRSFHSPDQTVISPDKHP